LQRLGEELQLGRRVAALLSPVVEAMRRCGTGPVRVVDVGCGLGFVVQAMAACSALGPDVELVGVDLNPVLVAGARRLAGREGLACAFCRMTRLRPGGGGPGGRALRGHFQWSDEL
jgi:SAM-dependent methyltransferase